tara:strand:- start:288 stop:464 length:177 start_codon:yes stop_codon:yes gene_type:complete
MKSYFDYQTVDVLKYNIYYNPKIKNKYLDEIITDCEIDDNFFESHYEEWDYDFLKDLD